VKKRFFSASFLSSASASASGWLGGGEKGNDDDGDGDEEEEEEARERRSIRSQASSLTGVFRTPDEDDDEVEEGDAGVIRLKAKFLMPMSKLSTRASLGSGRKDCAACRRRLARMGLVPVRRRPQVVQRFWSAAEVCRRRSGSLAMVLYTSVFGHRDGEACGGVVVE
jgi:hypothetical protein